MAYRNLIVVLVAAVCGVALPSRGVAQQANPVYVDDSPRAWELLQRARHQAKENEGEAVRLYQELLDEYEHRLVPRRQEGDDEFVAVRRRVLDDLRARDSLLARYRLMQDAEAKRLLTAGALRQVADTRSLTGSGLEALLQLAQQDLEAARFRAALAWLADAVDHPDLDASRAAHAWYMIGLASHYLGRSAHVDDALAQLETMGPEGRTFQAYLAELLSGAAPERMHGVSSLDQTTTSEIRELVGQTIWSVPLESTLLSRRFAAADPTNPQDRTGFLRQRSEGGLNTLSATVVDTTVYVNEGHTIRALDRFTGRGIWERTAMDRPQPARDRDNTNVGDVNVISVEGDALVTLTGHAYPTTRSGDGQVVCMDATTGTVRWATSLDRIGDDREYDGLFAHGAPLIFEGRVYVLARKVTKQLLTGCYVVALDLTDGQLVWIRHIASSGSKAKIARHFSTLTQDDGVLFVSTAVGAIASVDAATGAIRWLRRQSVPVTIRDRVREPWELNTTLVIDDRVVAITPDQRLIVALDRDTGEVLETHDARARDGWNSPAYLLRTRNMIFGIGTQVRAFSPDNLSRPRWRIPSPPLSSVRTDMTDPLEQHVMPGPPEAPVARAHPEMTSASLVMDVTLAGRVQAVDDVIVMSTREGVYFVDDETGRSVHRLDIDTTGNPLALDAQLLLAGGDSLEAYMSLDRAENMLRERLANIPDDPEPALSLVQLGIRVANLALVLEGTELSLAVLRRQPEQPATAETTAELFQMLLEVHRRRIATTETEQGALYQTIGDVATTPDQQVEYLLAYADGLADRAPARAVTALQTVLSDRALAESVRREAAILRPASFWATQRINELIAIHGPGVCRAQLADAETRLQQLASAPPEALIALAHEYPYTDTAVEAAVSAAQRFRDTGADRDGLAAVATLHHATRNPQHEARLAGSFVEMCLDTRHGRTARSVLAARVRHDQSPETSSGPRDPRAWLESLSPSGMMARPPRTGRQAAPAQVLRGRVLVPLAPGDSPPDRVVLYDRNQGHVQMLTTPELRVAWTAPVDTPAIELLSLDDEQVLLWSDDQGDPNVKAFATDTGALQWTTSPTRDVLDPLFDTDRDTDRQMPNGLPFDPRAFVVRVGADAVFITQRSGGVVAYDRTATDGSPRWFANRVLDQVHLVESNAFGLVFAGVGQANPGRRSVPVPLIVVLDPGDGRELHRIPLDSGALWMTSTPMGSLLCARSKGVDQIDLFRGERRWSNVSFAAMETRRGWLTDTALVIESRTGTLHALDLAKGTMTEAFDTAIRGRWNDDDLTDVHVIEDRIIARYHNRIVRYDTAGEVIGADVIADENREYRALIPSHDHMVVLSHHDIRQVAVPETNLRQTQHEYRVFMLSENCGLVGDILELPSFRRRLRAAHLIDDWLLVSSTAETLAVPLVFGTE